MPPLPLCLCIPALRSDSATVRAHAMQCVRPLAALLFEMLYWDGNSDRDFFQIAPRPPGPPSWRASRVLAPALVGLLFSTPLP